MSPDNMRYLSDCVDLGSPKHLNKSHVTSVPEATVHVSLEDEPSSGYQRSTSAHRSDDSASVGEDQARNDESRRMKSLEETRVDIVQHVDGETSGSHVVICGGGEKCDNVKTFETCSTSSKCSLDLGCQGNASLMKSGSLPSTSGENGSSIDASRLDTVLKEEGNVIPVLKEDGNTIPVKEEDKLNSRIIDDAKGGDEEYPDMEKICRICHLGSEQTLETDAENKAASELLELGCFCRGELSMAHSYCAEAWFKLKGNRICEICGETAKNVVGVADQRFMVEWNEHRITHEAHNSNWRRRGCPQGQPLCNFLMAVLVISFVLPWFLHINMF